MVSIVILLGPGAFPFFECLTARGSSFAPPDREVQGQGYAMSRVFHRIFVLGEQFVPVCCQRTVLHKNGCRLKLSGAEFFFSSVCRFAYNNTRE